MTVQGVSTSSKGMASVKASFRKGIHNKRHSVMNKGEEIQRRRTHPSTYTMTPLKIHHSIIATLT
jgi:hypothetical protein